MNIEDLRKQRGYLKGKLTTITNFVAKTTEDVATRHRKKSRRAFNQWKKYMQNFNIYHGNF